MDQPPTSPAPYSANASRAAHTARLNTLQVVVAPFTAQSHLTCVSASPAESPKAASERPPPYTCE